MDMDTEVVDPVSVKLEALMRESEFLKRRLQNGGPRGKQDRRQFRLKDIEERLIPKLVQQLY